MFVGNKEKTITYLEDAPDKIYKTVEYRKTRSNPQNSYYWAVVIDILRDEFGMTRDEMNEAIKQKFLYDDSKAIPFTKSTKTLNTKEFETLMEDVRRWAITEYNVYLPEPNEDLSLYNFNY